MAVSMSISDEETAGILADVRASVAGGVLTEFEELAWRVAACPQPSAIVQDLAAQVRLHCSASVRLLAWLLRYEVVDAVLVIEAMLLTDNFTDLEVCGTQDFEPDVLAHLKLNPMRPADRQFPYKPKQSRIKIDLLEDYVPGPERRSSTSCESKSDNLNPKIEPATHPQDGQSGVPQVPGQFQAKPQFRTTPKWEDSTRHILLSSMSAAESVRKLQQNFVHGSELAVLVAILRLTYDSKLYNRSFGNTAIQLLAQARPSRWEDAFVEMLNSFFTVTAPDHIQEVYKLKVAGQFLGHVLSARVIPWQRAFPVFDLEASSNGRIVLLALLNELKQAMGKAEVEEELIQLRNIDGLTRSDLAAAFWEMAEFDGMAASIAARDEQ